MAFWDEAVALGRAAAFSIHILRRMRGYERVLEYGVVGVYRDWGLARLFPGRV